MDQDSAGRLVAGDCRQFRKGIPDGIIIRIDQVIDIGA